MTRARIDIPQDAIADFCRRHHIVRLSLFGSVLRDDFTDESDVDVLVEFEEGRTPGLAFAAMQRELSKLLNREVQLMTSGFLNEGLRRQVIREAEVQYDAIR
jgi:uncharacterized protein